MSELNERLGFAANDRVLIISCDDFGLSHSSNEGVISALRDGAATCASIMVPAPWARHAARLVSETDDIGVHLTLNAEHEPSTIYGNTPTPLRCAANSEHR